MIINPNGGQMNAASGPKRQIDITKATDILCKCENDIFMPVMKFKKLSALVSPTGRDSIIPVEVYVCTKCGTIPEELDINI